MLERLRIITVAFIFLLGLFASAGTAFSGQAGALSSCTIERTSLHGSADCGKAMVHESCLYHAACGLFLLSDFAPHASSADASAKGTVSRHVLVGLQSAPEIRPPILAL
ncbi:hypothetical protein [Martelella sp. HB161492]|uniref:hypothetical protein n=1 Tax=Martelella sp. HB161492 TaxID=2720726 RepID=UPI001590BE4D|nr:hypothetical protein [Martelella sp. HB161492]